jgi:hypothetical protein
MSDMLVQRVAKLCHHSCPDDISGRHQADMSSISYSYKGIIVLISYNNDDELVL